MVKFSKQVIEHERRNALANHLHLVQAINQANKIADIISLEEDIENLSVHSITKDILLQICFDKIDSINTFVLADVDTSKGKVPRVR